MKTNMKTDFLNLFKLVDKKVRNEEEIHFLVKGDLASMLCSYVEEKWGLDQWTEDEEDYLEVFDKEKMYWFDLANTYVSEDEYEDGYIYFVQEAVYDNGLLAQNDEDDIVYLDTRHNLSESNRKRVLGKVIGLTVTDIDDCIDEIGATVDTEEYSCDLVEVVTNLIEDIDELDDRLEEALNRIEVLEKENKILKIFYKETSTKEKYYIDDKEVSKEEYEDYYGGLVSVLKGIDVFIR